MATTPMFDDIRIFSDEMFINGRLCTVKLVQMRGPKEDCELYFVDKEDGKVHFQLAVMKLQKLVGPAFDYYIPIPASALGSKQYQVLIKSGLFSGISDLNGHGTVLKLHM